MINCFSFLSNSEVIFETISSISSATTVCFVFPKSSMLIVSKSTENCGMKISMLLNDSLIASGPNLVPGRKE